MVKTFIQTVETQPWLRRGRQFLASILIFSMLVMDIAKAMEEEKDSGSISHTIPPILKYTGGTEPDSHSFNNYSSDSEDDSDKLLLGPTGLPSEKQKPEDQNAEVVPLIVPPPPQNLYPIPSSPFTFPTSVELGSVDSRSLESREQPLFTVSVNYPQLSSPLIYHPLEVDSASDEAHSLLENKHRQSKESVSIRQSGNIVKFQKQEPKPLPNPELLTSNRSDYSSLVSSSQKAKQDSSKKKKRQKLIQELIGDEIVEDSLSSKSQKKLSKPPLFPFEPFSHEKTSLLRNQSINEGYSSIQAGDFVRVPFRDEEDGDNPEFVEFTILDDTSRASRPLSSSDDQKYRSCCGRPILPQRTKYTLLDLGSQLHQPSQSLSLRQMHNPQEEEGRGSLYNSDSIDSEGSSPLNGSPTKIIRVDDHIWGDDSEDEDFSSEDLFLSPLFNSDVMQKDNRSDNLLTDTVSRPPLIPVDSQDLEVGISASQFLSFWESFTDNDRAQLKRYKHQELDGKSTWPQRLGKWIIGPIIGGFYGFAMGPVYMGGTLYLDSPTINKILGGPFGNTLDYYIMGSSAFDGLPRNAHLWKRAIGYLSTESIEKMRVFLTALGCILPSCVEPVYLITAELAVMQKLDLHGWDNLAAAYMIVLCPFLFADSFASNFATVWKGWDEDVKGNFGKWKSYLSRVIFREVIDFQPKPQSAIDRECLGEKLHKLKKFVCFHATSDQTKEIYEGFSQIKAGNIQTPPELNAEDLPLYKAYGALSYFFSLGDQVEEGQKQIKSLYETLTDVLTTSCLALGSPARFLVLQFIGETIFGLFCPKTVTQVLGWIFAAIGFPFQTGLEYKGMKNFFRDFIWEEEPHGHFSPPAARIASKSFILLQAAIYLFPLFVMCLQTNAGWNLSNGWMIGYIPFLFPEYAAQATNFNGTYNRMMVTSSTNLHNQTRRRLGHEPRTDWKKDQLIQLIEASEGDLESMSPELMHFFLSQSQE